MAIKLGFGPTKCDIVRLFWYSSLGENVKHMKRTLNFLSNGRHQLLKKLSRTAEYGTTWTILKAIPVNSVVMNTQDLYCEAGKNSHLALKVRVFCVIWQKRTQTRISWFRKKMMKFQKLRFRKKSGTQTNSKCHNLQASITNLEENLHQYWKIFKTSFFKKKL